MLQESVKRRIAERYQQMSNEGKLLSRTQLDQFYSTFRSRFGPDRLANLDGEALLETMHAHGNRDSLVYWLEFKNDDEFPASRVGGRCGVAAAVQPRRSLVIARAVAGRYAQAAGETFTP
jgi:5-methylcytosine-specific restriction protein B